MAEFCPKEHRATIVEKFRRHSCLHPIIPLDDEAGSLLTADEIYEGAVRDLWEYCYRHGLRQVWSYMWNCWYERSKWCLWARSQNSFIPPIRTTMIAKSFWKHFKHGNLAAFSRPRLDHVTYILVTETVAEVNRKLLIMTQELRKGRPKPLREWQKDFKAQWADQSLPDELRLMKRELRVLLQLATTAKAKAKREQLLEWIREDAERAAGKYHVSLENWVCSCPSYLVGRLMLCKHLVKAANSTLGTTKHGLRFYCNLRRYTSPPFYRIPGIHTPAVLIKDQKDDDTLFTEADLSEVGDMQDEQKMDRPSIGNDVVVIPK